MKIQPVIITCPGREEMFDKTLENLRLTLKAPPEMDVHLPIIQLDTNTCERRQERQERNSLSALEAALEALNSDDGFVLFLEDDLEFNVHLWHNLARWRPLQYDWFTFGSLYNPTVKELIDCRELNFFEADPNCVYGSQAYILSRKAAQYCVDHWWEVIGMQDIKISRLCASMNQGALYYHWPSLVQHVGKVSAWGGNFHYAPDYDGSFRSTHQG